MAEKSPKRISRIAAGLRQFRADVDLLEEQKYELLITNPHEWVGVYKRVFVFAQTFGECIEMLGDCSPHAVVQCLDPNPRTLILLEGACFSI